MLSYRHHFHAGNHADVLKHVTLVALLRALTRKEKPLCYIDTHAGRGLYGLPPAGGDPAPEWTEGIGRVFAAAADAPEAVVDWVSAVRAVCAGAAADEQPSAAAGSGVTTPRHYPGSPALAAHCLRSNDRLVLSELHPADAEALMAHFDSDPRVEAARRDGHDHLRRCLPPRERRALVLIDPAYERREECDAVIAAVDTALTRMATATVVVWYPLLRHAGVDRLLRANPGTGEQALLHIELTVRRADSPIGMNGSGMLVWNPPWQLDATLEASLPWLAARLDQGSGGWHQEWIRAPR